ncbi:ABC transporter ATP-binding protein [Gaopeijia maritima]|uniref:ABC transporter ATP-binding protein n=1 Tax=Gaopeijia maritima TaxID=3119007 RepID=A0ABU9E7P4_9BACT
MIDTLRRLARLLDRREKFLFGLILAGSLIGALLEMASVAAVPAFVQSLTDAERLRAHATAGPVLSRLGVETDVDTMRVMGLALVLIVLLKTAYLITLKWATGKYGFRRQIVISTRLFSGYLTSPYTLHLQRNSSDLLRNVNQDAAVIVGGAIMPLLAGSMEVFTLVTILGLLVVVEPLASVAATVVFGGTVLLFARLIQRHIERLGRRERDARARMIRAVSEGLTGIKTTRVLGREAHFLGRYAAASEEYAAAGVIRQVLDALPRLILEVVGVVGLLGLTAALIASGRTLESLVPTLTLLAVALVRLIPSFGRLTSAHMKLGWGRAALDGVYDDLRRLGVAAPGIPQGERQPTVQEAIRLEQVTFTYPEASGPSLVEVDMEIRRGQAVGLVGPTGSGKTTAVDVILGLLTPTEGRVSVDGVSLAGRERGWQRHVGYIPQDIFLSDTSIRQNIAFGIAQSEIDDDAVERALEAAQIREFVHRLPDGVNTMVGERGVRLSGGQRQRIGIARALYHDPDVLVMDEATSALDTETERTVMKAIEHLKGSRTLVIIAHRLSTVEACDRLYLLRDGRVEASGSYRELEAHSEAFQRLTARN